MNRSRCTRCCATIVFFALVATAMTGATASPVASVDDYPRDWDVDIVHYAFRLALSDTTDRIDGEADVTVRFAADGVREIGLDLVGETAGAGMSVGSVSRDGAAVSYTHAGDRLIITLASPSIAQERRTYRVAYGGVPRDGLIIGENMFGDRTFFGDNWPDRARHWLPSVDHVSDKATVEWVVTAPNHYQVIGNGELREHTDLPDGMRRTHWSSTVPIPTKVMVIGVARFAVEHLATVGGVPVQSWVYPQNRDEGFYDYAVAERMLRFFSGHIGPFPYAKLANVQSKTRYGGMENASNIFYSERSVSGARRSEGTVAHEIAHQWFGDSVTERDWHHIWLSEGFATYFTQLYNEFTYGRDRMAAGMRGNRQTVIDFYARAPELAVVAPSISDLNELLNRNSYQKGGWVLHMLRRQIGDEAFWAGIRAYYREHRDGNALTADLQRVMEEASGEDLGWFFEQWVFTPGHPLLEGSWSHDPAGGELTVTIRQAQPTGTVFRFPLDIGITTAAGETVVETIEIDDREETVRLPIEAAPAALGLDPDTWLLFEGGLTRR
jgi:aminopeptidase N